MKKYIHFSLLLQTSCKASKEAGNNRKTIQSSNIQVGDGKGLADPGKRGKSDHTIYTDLPPFTKMLAGLVSPPSLLFHNYSFSLHKIIICRIGPLL